MEAINYFYICYLTILILLFCYKCFASKKEETTPRTIYNSREYNRQRRDRQGNIFTISDEAGGPQNYPDFFVLEPNSQVRSPLDKDDKDLPTYEEVMALSNLTAPTAAAAGSITPTILPNNLPMEVPPYTETDPNPIATTSGGTFTVAIPAANNSSMPPATTTLPEPSTSRNVAAPAATSTVVVTTATGTAANV